MSKRTSRLKSPYPKDLDEFYTDCKAAYLSVYDDLTDKIESKGDLQLLLQQTGRNPSKKSIQKHWPENTENLSFDDFCDICKQEKPTKDEDLMKAFKKVDINGDGYVSLDELKTMMTSKGEKMSEREVKQIIEEVDENKDGKLDYNEFCNLFTSTTDELKKLSRRRLENKEKTKKGSKSPSSRRSPNEENEDDTEEESIKDDDESETTHNDLDNRDDSQKHEVLNVGKSAPLEELRPKKPGRRREGPRNRDTSEYDNTKVKRTSKGTKKSSERKSSDSPGSSDETNKIYCSHPRKASLNDRPTKGDSHGFEVVEERESPEDDSSLAGTKSESKKLKFRPRELPIQRKLSRTRDSLIDSSSKRSSKDKSTSKSESKKQRKIFSSESSDDEQCQFVSEKRRQKRDDIEIIHERKSIDDENDVTNSCKVSGLTKEKFSREDLSRMKKVSQHRDPSYDSSGKTSKRKPYPKMSKESFELKRFDESRSEDELKSQDLGKLSTESRSSRKSVIGIDKNEKRVRRKTKNESESKKEVSKKKMSASKQDSDDEILTTTDKILGMSRKIDKKNIEVDDKPNKTFNKSSNDTDEDDSFLTSDGYHGNTNDSDDDTRKHGSHSSMVCHAPTSAMSTNHVKDFPKFDEKVNEFEKEEDESDSFNDDYSTDPDFVSSGPEETHDERKTADDEKGIRKTLKNSDATEVASAITVSDDDDDDDIIMVKVDPKKSSSSKQSTMHVKSHRCSSRIAIIHRNV